MNNLESICDFISKLEKKHHIKILHIISKNPTIQMNQNQNGFYFRIDMFPENTIQEICEYIEYVQTQENTLNQLELKKEEIKREFIQREDKAI
jgi:hypothetical protein